MDVVRRNRGAFLVALIANCGSMLFGFDTGIAGSVVALHSFKVDFDLASSPTKLAYSSSNIVALLNAGAFFGSLLPVFSGKWLGRKHMLSIAGLLFLIGGILQTASSHPSLAMLYTGRIIAGLGTGIISNTTPVFVAECSPKHLRGFLMSLFEMFLVSGGVLAYWTTYGCSLHVSSLSSKQWRIPLSLQIILASIVFGASFFCPESPRWLAKADRYEDARQSLAFLRSLPETDPAIILELAEIKAQIDEEAVVTKGLSVKELFQGRNLVRLGWGLGVAFLAMWSGHNAILYYGPTVFKEIGFTAQNAALFASGMITVIKWIMTVAFIFLGVGRFKRKTLLIVGGFFMGVLMFALSATLATNPPHKGSENSPSGHGMMAIIYLFIISYSVSWGPIQWIYIGEIFPSRIRDYGMAACTMMVWAMNYIVSKITPIAVLHIGWRTFTIFGTFGILAAIFAVFLPETKDVKLEDMDILFGVVAEGTRREDVDKEIGELKMGGGEDVELGRVPTVTQQTKV